jgi:RNA polymerase-binding transcription factor DksA
MSIDTDRYRELLLNERQRVQAALDNLHGDHEGSLEDETDELATANDNHLGDLATATLNREIDFSLGENAEQHLADIDAALKRIEDGSYGTCVVGGEKIDEARLDAMPWASLCIDHARAREQGG